MPEILSIGELLDLGNSASTAGLIPYSALEFNGSGDISAISGSAIAGGVDTTIVSSIASSYVESGISGKVDQSAFDDCCSSVQSALSGKLDASASGQFAPSGDYVFNSAYSSFTGNTINNISSMSSIVSGLTGDYLDKSASSMFQPSGSYVSASDMSAYVPFSGFEYSAGTQTITAISGSAIGGAGGGSEFDGVYTDNTLSGSGLSASPLGVVKMDLEFDSASLTRTITGDTAIVAVRYPVYLVSSSADATAQDVVYIVTGSLP